MKNKISMKMGTVKVRGKGILNWTHLTKMFPEYADHIYRIRKSQEKLLELRTKLIIKFKVKLYEQV